MTDDDIGAASARERRPNPPAFNVPKVVLVLILVLAGIHLWRGFLGPAADAALVLDFGFIPGCFSSPCDLLFERRPGALLWSPLTHAFLHGDWTHLGLNTVWLLAFGTPVARRLGTGWFLLFCALGAAAGAGLFYLLNPDLIEPVIGASGVVSALMGGACRFAFATVGRRVIAPIETRRLSIVEALSDRTILFFILIFFATNILTGSQIGSFLSGGGQIAWEAHLGGFVFGFLSFAFFDRRRPASAPIVSQSP